MDIQKFVKLSTRLIRNYRRLASLVGLVGLLGLLGAGCGITEMNIPLAEQKFTYDLMNSIPFPIPQKTCPQPPEPYSSCQDYFMRMTGIIDNRVKASCDMPTNQCVIDLSLIIVYIINVAEDPAF